MRTQVALVGGFYCYAPAESLDLIADAWDLAALERSGASAAREPLVSTARRSVRVWNRPPPTLERYSHTQTPHHTTPRVRAGAAYVLARNLVMTAAVYLTVWGATCMMIATVSLPARAASCSQ